MVTLNCSIGYQNVEGLHSNLLGCKMESGLELKCDIEILAETWSACELCKARNVPEYHLLKKVDPEKKGKKGRSSGGLQIYCKKFLKKSIKILKSNDKYIWLELNKNLFENNAQSIKVCAVYSQPLLSNYYRETVWDDLETDIINFSTDTTPFCIIGDMNGRTGNRLDHEENRNNPFLSFKPTTINKSQRRNCDTKLNQTGQKILQLCCSYDMQIANGRFKGDIFGNFTHHNKNIGQSTVDLALVSDFIFSKIDDFKVLPQDCYSDHCKIILSIKNLKHKSYKG